MSGKGPGECLPCTEAPPLFQTLFCTWFARISSSLGPILVHGSWPSASVGLFAWDCSVSLAAAPRAQCFPSRVLPCPIAALLECPPARLLPCPSAALLACSQSKGCPAKVLPYPSAALSECCLARVLPCPSAALPDRCPAACCPAQMLPGPSAPLPDCSLLSASLP